MKEKVEPQRDTRSSGEKIAQLDYEFHTAQQFLDEVLKQLDDLSKQIAQKELSGETEGVAELRKSFDERLRRFRKLNRQVGELNMERAKLGASDRKPN